MTTKLVSYVGWLLFLSAIAFYLFSMGQAIVLSWPFPQAPDNPAKINPVLATTVSSIQAILLTNLGIVLGISISKPESNLAKAMTLTTSNVRTKALASPMELKEKIQLFCVALFVIVLIACTITWIKNNFADDASEVAPVIAESGKMFTGVVLAYFTALLSRSVN
ncbi:MAG: hypothetical protein ACK5NK_03855 [Niabella sp.]